MNLKNHETQQMKKKNCQSIYITVKLLYSLSILWEGNRLKRNKQMYYCYYYYYYIIIIIGLPAMSFTFQNLGKSTLCN